MVIGNKEGGVVKKITIVEKLWGTGIMEVGVIRIIINHLKALSIME
jgi:DNA-binding winged helix-turn-helix (wHTH) protein